MKPPGHETTWICWNNVELGEHLWGRHACIRTSGGWMMCSSIFQKPTEWFKNLSKSRKTLFVVFVVLCIFSSPWVYRHVLLLYDGTVCTINGGNWMIGGPGGVRRYCLYSYPDGGTPCHSSEECIGSCVIYEDGWGQSTPMAGVCQEDSNPYGSCFVIIESPSILAGCID